MGEEVEPRAEAATGEKIVMSKYRREVLWMIRHRSPVRTEEGLKQHYERKEAFINGEGDEQGRTSSS